MNKIIVLILIIFIIIYFIFNFDVYVIKKNKQICKPINFNHHNDVINDKNNNKIIKIHSHNLDVNQEMYNRINKQLQS